MKYYTYQLRLSDEVRPFYIGKGTGDRLNHHTMPFSLKNKSMKNSIIKKAIRDGQTVIAEVLSSFDDEESAFQEEKRLIALHGRRDIGTGILANHTDGGEGGGGVVHGDEYKKAMSEALAGREFTDQHREKISISKRNRMVVKDRKTGKHVSIHTSEYKENADKYIHNFTGKIPARDAAGSVMMISADDHRLESGELFHNSCGKPGANKGKKFSPETRDRMALAQWKKRPEIWGAAQSLKNEFEGLDIKNAYQLAKKTGFKESNLAAICKRFVDGWNPNGDKLWLAWSERKDFPGIEGGIELVNEVSVV